ncbi:MAG TPA: ankyrin repeat domain-containing protein [Elusimicrobiota bacterium]|nr:ankyrin repeat domain-containing protein [Elusimicrobiota bacterium]
MPGLTGCALLFSGCTTLSHDVRTGNQVTIQQKLDSGANVNSPDENFVETGGPMATAMFPSAEPQASGDVPLHWAALNGYADIAQLLIKHGADVNVQNGGNDTPLHWAALGGHADLVKLLVGAGADVNAADNSLDTPLHFAADVGSLDTVNALLSAGANPGARDAYGFLPADYACAEWDLAAPCPKNGIISALQNTQANPAPPAAGPTAAAPANAQPAKSWWQQ